MVNVFIAISSAGLDEDQTEKILAEQKQGMFNAQREAEVKRIELERTSSQANNQRSLMEATVGVEIAGKRSEQRKKEADGEAYYISSTGRAEAEKMQLIGEAQGVAYREQVNALGANGVALVETLKVIGEKRRIHAYSMRRAAMETAMRRRHRLCFTEFFPRPNAENLR